jgi:hypothetical protein
LNDIVLGGRASLSWSCRNATSSIPGKDALRRRKRRIDGFVLFFFETRDQFAGGDWFQGSTRD